MAKAKPTDLSRAERKAKKKALEDAIPDLPGDNEPESAGVKDTTISSEKKSKKRKREQDSEDAAVIQNGNGEDGKEKKKAKKEKKQKSKSAVADIEERNAGVEVVKAEKRAKKEKKDKKSNSNSTDQAKLAEASEVADVGMGGGSPDPAAPKKSKKERKAERRAAELAAKAADSSSKPVESEKSADVAVKVKGESKGMEEKKASADDGEKKSKKNNRNREKKRKGETSNVNGDAAKSKVTPRFIVFVGNLPYTANKTSLQKHFASVQPKSIRVLTEKSQPTKCRGAAFVEFEGYDHMKTCLKLFHHSNFDDGASAPRKINVELTAGGGANTKERKAKINAKNAKLNEERIRRMQDEEKAKATKALEGGNKSVALDESAIHPSRRRFVPGAQGA